MLTSSSFWGGLAQRHGYRSNSVIDGQSNSELNSVVLVIIASSRSNIVTYDVISSWQPGRVSMTFAPLALLVPSGRLDEAYKHSLRAKKGIREKKKREMQIDMPRGGTFAGNVCQSGSWMSLWMRRGSRIDRAQGLRSERAS
ncbi:hypothetical protein EVAR_4200_1 [Eumeta japonica]|uniref:Uncharacterized protein n=1 Tax=Eumeta variegata TaxID=151549 RepID=A0A4C1TH44_EUMVA|nr:hypothetical protein EVAR_4200_1 [Eumeta japonica]